jgi:membrane dipeptidase
MGAHPLVAWAVVGDLLWFDTRRYRHRDTPKSGEALGWLERELGRVKAHFAEQKIKIVRTAADVSLAVHGEPHVVLAVEGASFIENEISHVKRAYDLGIRHLQLVHYSLSTLGDIQTEPAQHNGLTEIGKQVVAECNRLGILVDLAHGTVPMVRDALSISKVPMVWSHGSVTTGPAPHPGLITWRARQLPLETAKAIAEKNGVVGLWALSSDVGKTVQSYAERLTELAGWLGDDHVGFGTDMNGLGENALVKSYVDLRQVVNYVQTQDGMTERRIRKMAIGNYARVLRRAPKVVRVETWG